MRRPALAALVLVALCLPARAQDTPAELQTRAWLGSVATQLQLAADQQAAFAAYAEAIRAQAVLREGHRTDTPFTGTAQLPPAPEALQRAVDHLRARADALAAVQAAAAALYAGLSAQQRIAFDFLAMTPTGTGAPAAY